MTCWLAFLGGLAAGIALCYLLSLWLNHKDRKLTDAMKLGKEDWQ